MIALLGLTSSCGVAFKQNTSTELKIDVMKKRDVAVTGGEVVKHVGADGTVTYVFKNPKEVTIKQ